MSSLDDSLKWELKNNPLFRELDEATFDNLLRAAKPKIYKSRASIFHEGDPGGSMLMVLSGQIKITSLAANGKECVLAFMGPGDVIGELTVLDGGARTASAQAIEASRVLELTRSAFMTVLENNPSTALKIIEILCKRLRATSEMVEDAALLAAAPRLARTLLRLARSNGVQTDDGVIIDLPLSQSTLGAHAGLLRESVNRQLRAWEAEKTVDRRDDRIIILREDILSDISEGGA
jgi:CRP/FNR family transcriptional regulator, cyclic AMP receptor protein